MPGVARENYWFRRHEAVYQWIATGLASSAARHVGGPVDESTTPVLNLVAPADVATNIAHRLRRRIVVDAGCGEGYGSLAMAAVGARCVAVDLDPMTIRHVARSYQAGFRADDRFAGPSRSGSGAGRGAGHDQAGADGWLHAVAANLDRLPLATDSTDLIVSLQVVEHLWDLRGFLGECLRVLRPGGELIISTPNRVTFSPGLGRGERPTNPFHVEEFDAEQLMGLVASCGFTAYTALGLRHGPRITEWERAHGDVVAAQVAAIQSNQPDQPDQSNHPDRPDQPECWPTHLDSFVPTVTAADFDLGRESAHAATSRLESDALDLIIVARKPAASAT